MKELDISDINFDDLNHNKGSKKGSRAISASVDRFGMGRSVLLDKNNKLIAGNKTTEKAIASGVTKVLVVETTGDTLVAVKRTDIDLDSKKGREMAIADNATALASIEFDVDTLVHLDDMYGLEVDDFAIELPDSSEVQDYEFEGPEVLDVPETRVNHKGIAEPVKTEKAVQLYPVTILLERNELNVWKAAKEALGTSSDKEAFKLLILKQV